MYGLINKIITFFKKHDSILALLCALVVGIPFLNKPFHIDDSFYLTVIDQILENPFRPFDTMINWNGSLTHVFYVNTNPPLLSYYLAPFALLFGQSEIILHMAMLLFLIILSFSISSLSKRFLQGSLWPLLFVMFCPAIIVSGNIMLDIPMVSLLTLTVAIWIKGIDENRFKLIILASILAGFTMLMKYSGAIVFPIIGLYSILKGRFKTLAALILGILIIGAWFFHNYIFYDITHIQYLMLNKRSLLNWEDHFTAGLTVLGSCLYLFPFLLILFLSKNKIKNFLLIFPIIPLSVFLLKEKFPEVISFQHYFWGIGGGIFLWILIILFVKSNFSYFKNSKNKFLLKEKYPAFTDDLFLFAFSSAVIYFSIFYVMFPAVRHVIPALTPLTILSFRLLQRDYKLKTKPVRLLIAGCLIFQGIVGFWAGAADYKYAESYRDFAKNHIPKIKEQNPTSDIWFSGSWGWHYYASKVGCKQLAKKGTIPQKDDIIIIPDRIHKNFQVKTIKYQKLFHVDYPTHLRLFTVRDRSSASFYALKGRCLPYLFLDDLIMERIQVYRATDN